MMAGADKLTEAVEHLKKNNAPLTTQLSDAMKINVEMAKALNLKATKGQDPEGTLLADNAKRKSAFERNLDSTGYFWTHGFRVTKRHGRKTCSTPEAGHQRMSTRKNIMEGSKAGKWHSGMGVDKLKLVNNLCYIVNQSTSRSNTS